MEVHNRSGIHGILELMALSDHKRDALEVVHYSNHYKTSKQVDATYASNEPKYLDFDITDPYI